MHFSSSLLTLQPTSCFRFRSSSAGESTCAVNTFPADLGSVLAAADSLPRFWIFMYRVSPFTYFVDGILSVAVAQAPAQCSSTELIRVIAPTGTCADFLGPYQSFAGGTIINPAATGECQFCSIATTDVFLSQVGINFDNRWRNFGIIFVYIIFNTFAAISLYWLARVVSFTFRSNRLRDESSLFQPKKSGKESGKKANDKKEVKGPKSEKPE